MAPNLASQYFSFTAWFGTIVSSNIMSAFGIQASQNADNRIKFWNLTLGVIFLPPLLFSVLDWVCNEKNLSHHKLPMWFCDKALTWIPFFLLLLKGVGRPDKYCPPAHRNGSPKHTTQMIAQQPLQWLTLINESYQQIPDHHHFKLQDLAKGLFWSSSFVKMHVTAQFGQQCLDCR